ncbi:MAG: hypothetical protein J1E35_07245 [Lachnospiraceae bacterium]|nr:hypothetical protein [Lachnospiraceae bacterium]
MQDYKKRKILLICAALAAIVSLLAGWYFTLRKGVYIDDDFFYKVNKTKYKHNNSNYIERISDNDFKIVSDTGERTVSLRTDADSLVFVFSDGTSLTGYRNGRDLTDAEGFPFGWKETQLSGNNTSTQADNAAYCLSLYKIYLGEYESISVWPLQALGLIIYISGIAAVLYPDKAHFFLRRWRYQNPELSDAGRRTEQRCGIAISVVGILVMSGVLPMLIDYFS